MDDEAHPLRKWLLSAHIFQHIVQVMELASYFRAFEHDPALPSKVEKLKRDSFWSTCFELAMATRAQRACRDQERVFLNPGLRGCEAARILDICKCLERIFSVEAS
jgi:hypothetical protein